MVGFEEDGEPTASPGVKGALIEGCASESRKSATLYDSSVISETTIWRLFFFLEMWFFF